MPDLLYDETVRLHGRNPTDRRRYRDFDLRLVVHKYHGGNMLSPDLYRIAILTIEGDTVVGASTTTFEGGSQSAHVREGIRRLDACVHDLREAGCVVIP